MSAPASSSTSIRGRAALATVARWTAFLVAGTAALWPVLTTSIVADDFYVLFYHQLQGGDGLVRSLEIGLDGADLGHFNYLGQVFGAVVAWVWIHLSFGAGLPFSFVFGATKLLTYLATAVAGARLLRVVVVACGGELSAWRARILVAIALFGTIQIHVPWSNDPVGSYPLSGFASAAIGMLLLSFAVEVYRQPTTRSLVALGLGGVASVLYYEINAAAVVGMAPLALLALREHWRSEGPRTTTWWVRAAWLCSPLVIAGVATVAFRLISTPEPGGYEYSGTTMTVDDSLVASFGRAVVSSLPGSAWKLSRDWLAAPIWIRPLPLLVLVALATALAFVTRRRGDTNPGRVAPIAVATALSIGTYWMLSTAIQVATPKVRSENIGIGYVYNYYAVGSTAVAVIAAGVVVLAAPRLHPLARRLAAPSVVALLVVQFLISWNVSTRFAEVTVPNRELIDAYAEDRPLDARCEALRNWAGGQWPDYYERGVVRGIEDAWQEFRGGPFCGQVPSP